jgi:hypothetical protein
LDKLVSDLVGDSCVTFFGDSFTYALVSWEGHERFVGFAEEEDVRQSGGKGVTGGVFDVDNIERTWMFLAGHNSTDATDVLTADDLAKVTSVEFDPVGDFAGVDVNFDGVANFAVWVGVTDGSTVVGNKEWDVAFSKLKTLHAAKLVAGLFIGDTVDDVSAFGIEDQTEVLVGFVDSNDIHETGWVFDVSSYFTVNFDHLAHHNLLALFSSESVVQTITDEDSEWQALTKLVWASVRAKREHTGGFGKHPMVWCRQGLEMFLWSATSHDYFF